MTESDLLTFTPSPAAAEPTAQVSPRSVSAYEAPELFEIGPAKVLLQGIVVTEYYSDCTLDGSTTRYPPRC